MDVEEAYDLIEGLLAYEAGAFYGAAGGMAVGAGLFVANLRLPLLDAESQLYKTVRGNAYVVTHECDVAEDNERAYNDWLLVCPIIHFEAFVGENQDHPNFPAFLGAVARRNVPRILYIPTLGEPLPYGGVLYLNRITSTHISAFDEAGVARLGAVSATGLREVDAALQNLLMREKADRLWGMRY